MATPKNRDGEMIKARLTIEPKNHGSAARSLTERKLKHTAFKMKPIEELDDRLSTADSKAEEEEEEERSRDLFSDKSLVRSVLSMARRNGGSLLIDIAANELHVSPEYLSRIVSTLADLGMLKESRKGELVLNTSFSFKNLGGSATDVRPSPKSGSTNPTKSKTVTQNRQVVVRNSAGKLMRVTTQVSTTVCIEEVKDSEELERHDSSTTHPRPGSESQGLGLDKKRKVPHLQPDMEFLFEKVGATQAKKRIKLLDRCIRTATECLAAVKEGNESLTDHIYLSSETTSKIVSQHRKHGHAHGSDSSDKQLVVLTGPPSSQMHVRTATAPHGGKEYHLLMHCQPQKPPHKQVESYLFLQNSLTNLFNEAPSQMYQT